MHMWVKFLHFFYCRQASQFHDVPIQFHGALVQKKSSQKINLPELWKRRVTQRVNAVEFHTQSFCIVLHAFSGNFLTDLKRLLFGVPAWSTDCAYPVLIGRK